MDLELWFRYLLQYGQDEIKFTAHNLVHFRLHDQSKTKLHYQKFGEEINTIFYSLLLHLNAPNFLLEFATTTKKLPTKPICLDWKLNFLDKKQFLILFIDKYLATLNFKVEYAVWLKCNLYRLYVKHGNFS